MPILIYLIHYKKYRIKLDVKRELKSKIETGQKQSYNQLSKKRNKKFDDNIFFKLEEGPFYKDRNLTLLIVTYNYLFMIACSLSIAIKFFDNNII